MRIFRKPSRSARVLACAAGLAGLAAVAAWSQQVNPPTKITNGVNAYGDDSPSWSPSGGRIAYDNRNLDPAYPVVYCTDMPSGPETQLTGVGEPYPDYQYPAYSHDGAQIAYAKKDGTWYHLYVRPATGGAETPVTSGTAGPSYGFYGDWFPAWSPDGQWIAFGSSRGDVASGMFDIWVVKPDGSGLHRVTSGYAADTGWPSWSPDGNRLVFSQNNEVWQVARSGGAWGTASLLWNGGNHPSFSPDGAHIAYDDAGDILVRAYGPPLGAPIAITSGPDDDRSACWSPDGASLAFSSNHGDGNRAIWVATGVDKVPTVPVTLGRIKAAYR